MRRKVTLFLFAFLLMSIFVGAQNSSAIKLYYDGQWHDYKAQPIFLKVNGQDIISQMPPIVFGEYSLVPAREVFEALGAKVEWNDSLKLVNISNDSIRIILKIESKTAIVNGAEKLLDIAPKLINSKTMIPARFVSEELGLEVNWEDKERTIYINNKPKTTYIQEIKYNSSNDIITNVSYNDSNAKKVQIDIKANSQIAGYSTSFLSYQKPYRLVIDINDSILDITQKNILIDENDIEQIRTAQFSVNPNTTRIVIDLNKPLKYQVNLSEDKKHILVDILVSKNALNPGNYRVVLDPGHGGKESGASYGGIHEKNLNLNISLYLRDLLKDEDIEVYMTREDDATVDLYDRSGLANRLNADLLVSIHNNAIENNSSFGGTMTLYNPDASLGYANETAARIIQQEIVAALGTKDLGIRPRPGLAVLRTSQPIAVLVEVAYMSNPTELNNLKNKEYQKVAAQALKEGIIKVLNEK